MISATLETLAPGFTCKLICTKPSLSVLNFIGPDIIGIVTTLLVVFKGFFADDNFLPDILTVLRITALDIIMQSMGSVLIFLNGPLDRLEFSLNGVFGRTASKFEGFHMIPCDNKLNFVSYRIGGSNNNVNGEGAFISLILNFKDARVIVLEWSQEEELFKLKADEAYEEEMIDKILKYPGLISYQRFMQQQPESEILWHRFTRFITNPLVSRIFSKVKRGNGIFEVTPMLESHHSLLKDLKDHVGDPNVKESLQFTNILSLKDYSKIPGIDSKQVTKCAMDRTAIFQYLNIKISDLLAELQISFLLLTFAQNFEGFEQWLDIVSLLLQSFELALTNTKEYEEILEVIQEHLEMCPDDFFSGLMNENKLYKLISTFFANTERKFFYYEKFYEKKFGWTFEGEDFDEDDEPVIVE